MVVGSASDWMARVPGLAPRGRCLKDRLRSRFHMFERLAMIVRRADACVPVLPHRQFDRSFLAEDVVEAAGESLHDGIALKCLFCCFHLHVVAREVSRDRLYFWIDDPDSAASGS